MNWRMLIANTKAANPIPNHFVNLMDGKDRHFRSEIKETISTNTNTDMMTNAIKASIISGVSLPLWYFI